MYIYKEKDFRKDAQGTNSKQPGRRKSEWVKCPAVSFLLAEIAALYL